MEKLAKRAAFRLLSMRCYHSVLLFKKLEKKGFSKEACEFAIKECGRLGFLQDEEVILRELRRGFGPRYIEFKFQLPRGEARRVISRSMQKEQVLKMLPKLGERNRAFRALQRRGFDIDIVVEIFSLSEID